MTTTVRSRHPQPLPTTRLNRSRSGDGLKQLRKGKSLPTQGRSTSCIAIVIVSAALFILGAATIALQFVESHPNVVIPLVRRRQQALVDRNADDYVPDTKDAAADQETPQAEKPAASAEEEQIYDGGRYQGEEPKEGEEEGVEEVAIEGADLETPRNDNSKDQREQENVGTKETEKSDQISEEVQPPKDVALEHQETNKEQPDHQHDDPKIETGTDHSRQRPEKPPREVEPLPALPPEDGFPKNNARIAAPLSENEHGQPIFRFCDFMRKSAGSFASDVASNHGYVNPAVLVLGMEDLTTDLVWHVLAQILYPNRLTTPKRTEHLTHLATAIDYPLLDKPSVDYQAGFWRKVSDKSKGKWMVHVFCQQQEHDLAMGFPWLTTPGDMITKNHKAQDSLDLIKTMPKGSVKVVRVKRNPLDAVIREAQRTFQARANTQPHDNVHDHTHAHSLKELTKVSLDHKHIFVQLHDLQAEQKAVDDFLVDHKIPHLTVDFESLFPFGQWNELVQLAQEVQDGGDYLNTNHHRDYAASPLEVAWRDILKFLNVAKPLTMFDILQASLRTHKVNTFWLQKEAVQNWPYIDQALQGTHYQDSLRKEHPQVVLKQQQPDGWGEGDEM